MIVDILGFTLVFFAIPYNVAMVMYYVMKYLRKLVEGKTE